MRAGIPHDQVVQFIAAGSLFGHRRVDSKDGRHFVVVPADLPDGGRLELWVEPAALPFLMAALMGRPAASPELGAPQPFDPCDPAGDADATAQSVTDPWQAAGWTPGPDAYTRDGGWCAKYETGVREGWFLFHPDAYRFGTSVGIESSEAAPFATALVTERTKTETALASCECPSPTPRDCGHCGGCDTCLDCGRCAGRGCRCSCEER